MFGRRKNRTLLDEVREQASNTATQARRVTAAGLSGAANAVDPAAQETGKKRRRRLPILLSAIAGGIAAVKLARSRRQARDDAEASESGPRTGETVTAPSAPSRSSTSTTSSSTKSGTPTRSNTAASTSTRS
jgi:hypothetical protein